jgi:cytochrome b pre-mRNA-processing protein 3
MVFGLFSRRGKLNRWAVDRLHQAIQNQALRPDFYFEGGARDNFSGRFELTALHATLAFRRLRNAGSGGKQLAQAGFEALFDGFDDALREIGTGDLSVGKKIRKMGEAFYGRAKAYDDALAADPASGELERSLVRNMGVSDAAAPRFAKYIRSAEDALGRHSNETLLTGEINWPKPPSAT